MKASKLKEQLDYWRYRCKECARLQHYKCEDGCTYEDDCNKAYNYFVHMLELEEDWEKKPIGELLFGKEEHEKQMKRIKGGDHDE